MPNSLSKFITNVFSTGSQKEKNFISLYNYLKHGGYTQEEADVIKRNYSFLKISDDNFYIYKHDFTKEISEISPLGSLRSGKIDLHNYELDEIDNTAW